MLIHADADAFFASVEQRDFPHLRGRPMVVGPQVVACASYEARAAGDVPRRDPARRRCASGPGATDLAGWSVDGLVERRVARAMAKKLVAIRDGVDDATIRLPGPRTSISSTRSLGRAPRQRSVEEEALRDNVVRALERLGDDPREPTRLDVHLRYDDQHAVIQSGSLDEPTRDVPTLVGAALAALGRTAYEEDGRGVAMMGVSFTLPTRRP